MSIHPAVESNSTDRFNQSPLPSGPIIKYILKYIEKYINKLIYQKNGNLPLNSTLTNLNFAGAKCKQKFFVPQNF